MLEQFLHVCVELKSTLQATADGGGRQRPGLEGLTAVVGVVAVVRVGDGVKGQDKLEEVDAAELEFEELKDLVELSERKGQRESGRQCTED